MPNRSLVCMAVALGSGLMIGAQLTFLRVIGRVIGPARASPLLNVSGGILAGAILLASIGTQDHEYWNIPPSALISLTIAVLMGMLIIRGDSFSFQRTGIAAGMTTLFLEQPAEVHRVVKDFLHDVET